MPRPQTPYIRINDRIFAPEVRLISDQGENIGVVSREEALERAREAGLDLIEIAPTATPPIAKIMDYGKFQYSRQKKQKGERRTHSTETKGVQVKIGTGQHDLELKAQKAAEWLREGDRIKIDLFLPGRAKYLEREFLEERLKRFLNLIPEDYKMAFPPAKSPKGLTVFIDRAKKT